MRVEGLHAVDTRTAAFVGLAQKGPLDIPLCIKSWTEFLDLYGMDTQGYLSRSVEGFFQNGGEQCYVVRVAHRAKDGEKPGMEHATCAERVYIDGWDKPTLRVRARSEGRWGNNIWSHFTASTGPKALLTMDLDVGAGVAQVSTTRGFERGALVKIFDRDGADYVILTEIDEADRQIHWSTETPVRRRYRAAGPTYLEVFEFELHVALRDQREVFRGLQLSPLSRRYVERVIENESHLVRVDDLKTKSPPPHFLPIDRPAEKMSGGRDGADTLTADDLIGWDHGPGDRRGLNSLLGEPEVAVIAIPDAVLWLARTPGPQGEMALQRVQDAMINQCENEKDRFAILDAPNTFDVEAVRRWRRRIDTSYAAIYYPWIEIRTPTGELVAVPPSGHIAGIASRLEKEVGVHQAPANAIIKGAQDLTVKLTEDHMGILDAEAINCLRMSTGRGIRVWGARTLASDPDWRYVNVRRLFIMLRRSLSEGTRWVVWEPNTPNTWELLTNSVNSFLLELWNQGMFAAGKPEESFFVQCDDQTNTLEVREQGQMVIRVGVAPAIPAEFIMVKVVQVMGNEVVTESSVE